MSRIGLLNVTKRFLNQTVLSNISLDFAPGQVTCLWGPSGIGKTTVLRLLLGLIQPDMGQVFTPERKSAVFQEDRLLPWLSPVYNLRFVTEGREDKIIALLTELGLSEDLKKPVSDFSGGMKRRVAIARALVADYDLLLLDEPFKGLDQDSKAQAARLILKEARGKTMILVSHDQTEAELMGARLLSLSPGKPHEKP